MSREILARMRQPFKKGAGLQMWGMLGLDNGGIERANNAAGSGMIDLIGTNNQDKMLLNGAYARGMRMPITFVLTPNGSITTQRFFQADQPYEISRITCSFATADGATNTANITREITGQAPGTGKSVMTGTFNMNATANTVQVATIANRSNPGFFGTGEPSISVNTGEMLSFNLASAVTNLAGVTICIYAIPQSGINPAVFYANATAAVATQAFYMANRYQTISSISISCTAVASGAGTITLNVTKDTGTTAPGAGTGVALAATSVNNAATALINTPTNVPLSATASVLNMAPGDRLSLLTSGTLTGLAGEVIVVTFGPSSTPGLTSNPVEQLVLCYGIASNTNADVDASFFIADRDYFVNDVSGIWSATSTNVFAGITIDTGTTAPGAGTIVQTDNTSKGFDTSGTINTTNVGTISVSRRTLLLPEGARLSVHHQGTTKGTLAGELFAVSLISA